MSRQEYLDLLQSYGLNTLRSYDRAVNKRDCLAYGVIVSKRDIRVSDGNDHSLTCYISDPSLEEGTCSVIVFSRNINTLKAFQVGRIVRMKNFYLQHFQNNPQLTLNAYAKYAIYEPKTLEVVQLEKMTFPSSGMDINIIKSLDAWSAETGMISMARIANKRPLLKTDGLYENPSKYFDYVGEIVNIEQSGPCTVLTLTDYTENPCPPPTPADQSTVDPRYLINCSAWDEHQNDCADLPIGSYVSLINCIKKMSEAQIMEFGIHGAHDYKRKIFPLKPGDELLKNLLIRKEKIQQIKPSSGTKRQRTHDEPYPLKTEFIHKRRGGFKTFKQIKSGSADGGVCEIKARIVDYSPQNIEDWIQSYCPRCALYSPLEKPCRRCMYPTCISYKFIFTLKDEDNEELKVHSNDILLLQVTAQEVSKSSEKLEKLKKIIRLATDPDEKVLFDFCIGTVPGTSQFMNTRFVLAEDD